MKDKIITVLVVVAIIISAGLVWFCQNWYRHQCDLQGGNWFYDSNDIGHCGN